MPYPFAHVAAVVPLRVLLGKRGLPSALVIGSIVPDLWYFVPLVEREHAHSLTGLLWFCLPISLFLYLAFHLLFKQPLLDLMPETIARRLSAWTGPTLPPAAWHAVFISIVAGGLVHLAWDAMTHPTFPFLEQQFAAAGRLFYVHQVLQHASTVFGMVFLVWWCWRKLKDARIRGDAAAAVAITAPLRAAILAALLVPTAIAFCMIALMEWPSSGADLPTIRSLLRAAATTAISVLGLGVVAYSVLWKLRGGFNDRQRGAPDRSGASPLRRRRWMP